MRLNKLLEKKEIILASLSPRRRELLKGMDIPYILADPYEVDEVYPPALKAAEVPAYLSQIKSEGYPNELADHQILITADTLVILDSEIIGKPLSRPEAIDILTRLSGNMHRVVTGVTLRSKTKSHTFSALSEVYFGKLSDNEIAYYIDTYQPFDKAGAYGIQEWIGYVGIERIEGSFYNVMGLPTRQLYQELIDFL